MARGEHDRPAVRREREFLRSAEGLGGAVGVHAPHHIHRGAAGCRHDEKVRAPAILPLIPVSNEQAIVNTAGRSAIGELIEPLFDFCRAAGVGEHVHGKGDAFAVRRDRHRGNVEWLMGKLLGLTAVKRDAPHLEQVGAFGEKPDGPPVGSPARIGVVLGVRSQPPQAIPVRVDKP